jgi:hypothetical protein
MMKILWKNHPYNSAKNGTTEHVARELAVVAVGYGQAELIRFANAAERLKAASEEFAITQPPSKTEWSVNAGSASKEVYILGRCTNPTCDVIRYHGPAGKFNTLATHGQTSRVFDPAAEIVIAHACGKGAEKIPADILKRYAAAKAEERQFITPDQAEMYKMQTHVGQDNKHREIDRGPRG